MPGLSHIVILFAVFSFMTTVVSLTPAIIDFIREHWEGRLLRTTRELDKFFLHIKPTYLIGGAMVIGGVLGVVTENWGIAVGFTLASIFVPRLSLSLWKSVRSSRFDSQLADAMILIGNALRSGLDIATGIELVSTNMKAPISEEFGLVMNTYRLGGSLETALMEMTRRMKSTALETAVNAIVIQRETGGNLIRTFDQLVVTIREESKLQRKIQALSSQGRTQIAFLSVFPWAMLALFYFISPDMIQPALASKWGPITLSGLVVWEVIGIVVTRRIVTVDV
jgi:tight adherence protein B